MAQAVSNLDNAERPYASGDDAAVFVHLRGALDALPGAKKAILDDIRDERKESWVEPTVEGRSVRFNIGHGPAS